MKGCAWTQKTEPSLNFYVYVQTLMHSLYIIYVRKINARLRIVPYVSSGIEERAKRERA